MQSCFCIALSGALLHSDPWVGASLYAVCFLGYALWLSSVLFSLSASFLIQGRLPYGGGRSFFGGERFSWEMLLTVNFSLVKLITVNLEEAKLPVKNFYTSSSAMFSSGSYWDVATALSFYSPEVAPTRNLLLLNRSVNEKEPAVWRVLSVWGWLCELMSWIDGRKEAWRIFRATESSVDSSFCFS